MLCELRVKNLALIETLDLTFDHQEIDGLVVMTGETGAGKSIMLRAIDLLSGRRASAGWVRSGEECCEIEALFEVNRDHRSLMEKLRDGGYGEDKTIIIRRILSSSGRSRFYVNGSLATARMVAEISSDLLNMAGQHDQQKLLQTQQHLDFLDTVGEHWPGRLKLKKKFDQWRIKQQQLKGMRQREQEKEQRRDFLDYQVREIREAAPEAGEDELLAAEKKRLKNSQTLMALSQDSYMLLSHELMDGLVRLRQNTSQIATLDAGAAQLSEDISNYTFLAEDHINSIRAYKDSLESDPYRLDQINERLDLLSQFKRKYGPTLGDVILFAEEGEKELRQLENMDKEIAALEGEVATFEKEVMSLAAELSMQRRRTGDRLMADMEKELVSLAFDKPRFVVHREAVDQSPGSLRENGWDRVEFFFSANQGESPRPLAKIASGGELSRLMLAMKCLLAKKDMVETVIFDEVDAGIGGEAAEAVARKIQELAGHHQVFCITHLPQIAARGLLHFQVVKRVSNGRTQTTVEKLSNEMRIAELVRMLAGDSATEQTEAWAKELLANSKRSIHA
ncbi:DNA repair protein RecN [Desulforhopalus singaporensis]|uniref:DNA repair protein RecN n=1 Tax=Desulforhopalus singaporensis TaxID=91360 RepID=A0A1H0UL70_9BACT|nr:DNA repair protein RecN [Desulforhopalus singaporensis]SDP66800.1 DNA replication and repair protein RecN [Desulforhopalus singaporensis]